MYLAAMWRTLENMRSTLGLRWTVAILIALLIALGVLSALVPKLKADRASATAASQCQTTAAESTARSRVVTGSGPLRVTVLGDSYAQGYLMRDPGKSWPSRLARPLHARVAVRSLGGTGFVASPCGPADAYPGRVASVASTRPQLVIVEGGLNDVLADPAAIADGLRRTLAGLTSVRVVVVGPAAAPRWRTEAKRVDHTLAVAARSAGVQYVSALDWPLSFAADGIHLTEASHRVFGDRVAAAIR